VLHQWIVGEAIKCQTAGVHVNGTLGARTITLMHGTAPSAEGSPWIS